MPAPNRARDSVNISLRESFSAWRDSSAAVRSATKRSVVMRMAEARRSCSACESRSAAQIDRIGRAIGQHEDFARAGDHIDIYHAVEQALGCGDVNVARADNLVHAGMLSVP